MQLLCFVSCKPVETYNDTSEHRLVAMFEEKGYTLEEARGPPLPFLVYEISKWFLDFQKLSTRFPHDFRISRRFKISTWFQDIKQDFSLLKLIIEIETMTIKLYYSYTSSIWCNLKFDVYASWLCTLVLIIK